MNQISAAAALSVMIVCMCQASCTSHGPGEGVANEVANEKAHSEVDTVSRMKSTAAPSLDELRAASYHGVYDTAVTLDNGEYLGKPYVEGGAARPRLSLVEGFYVIGELTQADDTRAGGGTAGDPGANESAAVLLAEQAGGSGTRIYLAIVGRDATSLPINLGTALLGDRVQIINGRISDRGVDLRLVRAGPGDPACCPGEVVDTRWQLVDGSLVRQRDEITGRLSVDEWSGQIWRLQRLDGERSMIGDARITLRLDGRRLAGHSGCNNYFGGIEAGAGPGEISVGMLAGTRMACEPPTMDLETAYLQTLQSATRFSFLAGRLALSSVDTDGTVRTLLFTRTSE